MAKKSKKKVGTSPTDYQELARQPPRMTVLGDGPLPSGDATADHLNVAARLAPIFDVLRHPKRKPRWPLPSTENGAPAKPRPCAGSTPCFTCGTLRETYTMRSVRRRRRSGQAMLAILPNPFRQVKRGQIRGD